MDLYRVSIAYSKPLWQFAVVPDRSDNPIKEGRYIFRSVGRLSWLNAFQIMLLYIEVNAARDLQKKIIPESYAWSNAEDMPVIFESSRIFVG